VAEVRQDQVVVQVTEVRTFCEADLRSKVRDRANALASVTVRRSALGRVKAPEPKTVPIASTIAKTISKEGWTIDRTHETIGRNQFRIDGIIERTRETIDKIRFRIGATTERTRETIGKSRFRTVRTTESTAATISGTVVPIASTTESSRFRIESTAVMKFALR
jgi:hypothetical protein